MVKINDLSNLVIDLSVVLREASQCADLWNLNLIEAKCRGLTVLL